MAKLKRHTPPPGWKNPLAPQQPLASARWLLGGVAATLGMAAVCVYVTFCLLFWQGQWQLVFKPSRSITATPATAGMTFDEISFDATETGILQLNGWWIPAEPNAPYAAETLIFLHGGSGSLSDTLPRLQALHNLGINVFAFDYRGFGKSLDVHPSQATTYEDADAAWRYLADTRHVSPSHIVLDGVGLGAAIAAETAHRHPQAPALILEDPLQPTLDSLQFDARTHILPIRLLFHDRFDPTETLARLRTPKLMMYSKHQAAGRYYDAAAEPKQQTIVANDGDYLNGLRGFLGKYLPGA
ncbi:MAG: alpha/beta fold hydrolase [Acidobacteriaceae bacterium]